MGQMLAVLAAGQVLAATKHLLRVSYISYIPTIKISMVHRSNLCRHCPIRMLHIRLPLN